MSLLRPNTIRGQLITGLILLEGLLLLAFSALTLQERLAERRIRAERRLEYQVTMLASEAGNALADQRLDRLAKTLSVMQHSPTILAAQITDAKGKTIAGTDTAKNGTLSLDPAESARLPELHRTVIFDGAGGQQEAAGPILVNDRVVGYVWIYPNALPDERDIHSLLLLTFFYILGGAAICVLLASLLARSITDPLQVILVATRHLVEHPEDTSAFPLALSAPKEATALAAGLNLMVASIEEQRAGLNDTLALLDSMLANAPIGFAFFDRKYRLVRINRFLADLNHMSISLHLGRTVAEILPPGIADPMQKSMEAVFETGRPVRDLELTADLRSDLAAHPDPDQRADSAHAPGREAIAKAAAQSRRSWLANIYPVKTGAQAVRWVGAIIVDTTERKSSEDALRKTEKLAATGRLAASIAHEINNPLEAVTNLLYLLRHHSTLDEVALAYAEQAQHEVARVSEITQQTLRFYRQSTLPLVSSVTDLLDSVLTLHQGRVNSLQVKVVRKYGEGVELFCFAGEMRQLFANLVGNALDAMMHGGGRLSLGVRWSRSWQDPSVRGVRVRVADTGTGMEESVRGRIFEPFFTTKEVTGTGLGLWVSAEIIQKHGGIVRVRSRAATSGSACSGTVFMVFFPQTGAAVTAKAH